ncbi:TIGR03546 family protein [Roseiconus nitratireducens]|uniref:TIGR03546 family protein n=1 Tax=Roseiconus nitratireducens TaxID=2605748 RepID=A0A5M6DCZ2_9BACT|nr:TIGR03546 family protein [Roseiconus nitratireducens]KAA5545273.1 TIGR03546 family protein [Roseiconus nitratireducens]
MVIFSLKLLNNVRKAIAGRRFPHQLAGGVALGVLLGIIPHGNLLAVLVLLTVLSFRVNHAMLGVVAIVVSFGAAFLDPYSHRVGDYLLSHPTGLSIAQQAWALPLVPWTDLNNTVVLGSFTIGLFSTGPIFLLALPLFRRMAPADTSSSETVSLDAQPADAQPSQGQSASNAVPEPQAADAPSADPAPPVTAGEPERQASGSVAAENTPADTKYSVVVVQDGHATTPPPRFDQPSTAAATNEPPASPPSTVRIDSVLAAESEFRPESEESPQDADSSVVSVETRIDVIRMKDFREESADDSETEADPNPQATSDEALNYLLRRLRHSQQRKAAG